MSLDWDTRQVKDQEVHFPPNTEHVNLLGTMNRSLYSIIWGTISTRIGKLTDEAECEEFYRRYVVWHRVNGWPDSELPFTLEDVKHATGLKTNVFPRATRKEWAARMFGDEYGLERLVPLS